MPVYQELCFRGSDSALVIYTANVESNVRFIENSKNRVD